MHLTALFRVQLVSLALIQLSAAVAVSDVHAGFTSTRLQKQKKSVMRTRANDQQQFINYQGLVWLSVCC